MNSLEKIIEKSTVLNGIDHLGFVLDEDTPINEDHLKVARDIKILSIYLKY